MSEERIHIVFEWVTLILALFSPLGSDPVATPVLQTKSLASHETTIELFTQLLTIETVTSHHRRQPRA